MILTIVIAGCVFYTNVIQPKQQYEIATECLANNDYEGAFNGFYAAGNYEDAIEKRNTVGVEYALEEVANKDYKNAIYVLETIGGNNDSNDCYNQARYGYILENRNNDDKKTFEYLKGLKTINYKDAEAIYKELYEWRAESIINTSADDSETDLTSVKTKEPLYFHVKLIGGEPGEEIYIYNAIKHVDGNMSDKSDWDYTLADGETTYSYYEDGYDYTGVLTIYYYDDENNLIGQDSVTITN